MANTTRTLRFIGDVISYPLGDTTIELQWLREGVYLVTVLRGTSVRQVQDMASWPTEEAGRAHARGLAVLLKQEHSATSTK